MNLGRLRVVENKEITGRSSRYYYHILVMGDSGLETLVLTERELDTIRGRSSKNTEDIVPAGFFDKLASWLLSLVKR